MTIYTLAVDFFNMLVGDIAQTPRGQLVGEYFGYIVCGLTIYLLVQVATFFISYPFKLFKKDN